MTDEQTAAELCKWLEPMAEPAGMSGAFWRAAGPRGRNRGDALIDMEAHKAAIVRALQASRTPPPGHIIDDAGVVRKVLGDLAITADGFIACQNSVVWHPTDGGCYPVPDGLNMAAKVYGGARLVDVGECYSTLDAAQKANAAEAAKEAQ